MLPQIILDMILAKFGKNPIYSADCGPLADEIGIGETTIKRMFGLVGVDSPERKRIPRKSTMDILSEWLGYADYKALLQEIGEGNAISEFISLETVETNKLDAGTQIQLRYQPDRAIVMSYLGGGEFLVNESRNSKLLKGDRVRVTHLVLGQEMIISDVNRNGRSLGGYVGAKEGGLTSLEIIA